MSRPGVARRQRIARRKRSDFPPLAKQSDKQCAGASLAHPWEQSDDQKAGDGDVPARERERQRSFDVPEHGDEGHGGRIAVVMPIAKSTGDSVATLTSSAMRYSGFLWSPVTRLSW
jgi:hypothetical protein